mgnify:CR=1 FL=1
MREMAAAIKSETKGRFDLQIFPNNQLGGDTDMVALVDALMAEQNIAKMFVAAMVPGILAAIGYMIAVAVFVRLRPDAGPAAPATSGVGWEDEVASDDDVPLEDSGLVGRAVVERVLGGRLLEERPNDA